MSYFFASFFLNKSLNVLCCIHAKHVNIATNLVTSSSPSTLVILDEFMIRYGNHIKDSYTCPELSTGSWIWPSVMAHGTCICRCICTTIIHFTLLLLEFFWKSSLADLGGVACTRHTPPTSANGIRIHFHQKAPTSEVDVPPQQVDAPLREILHPSLNYGGKLDGIKLYCTGDVQKIKGRN